MTAAFAGLAMGLSLIIAIGAQIAFVLRQGLAKSNVGLIVLICALSDALLIFLGVAGLGAAISALPWLLQLVKWLGVAYLLWFAIRTWLQSNQHSSLKPAAEVKSGRWAAAATALMLTYLNPHVYLDTVILLGSIANQFGQDRWMFAIGAMTGSVLWFTGLGYAAKALSKFASSARFWKIFDRLVALVIAAIAISLVFNTNLG